MASLFEESSHWSNEIGGDLKSSIFDQLHWQAFVSAIFVFIAYNLFSTYLQYRYYFKRRRNPESWKVAPTKTENLEHAKFWWIPILSLWNEKHRGPNHALYATCNLLQACCFTFYVVHCIMEETSSLYFNWSDHSLPWNLFGFLLPHIWQGVFEYYWHICLHWGPLYRTFHKIHHYYLNPEPFDDMYIHPLEGFGYYCILYSPPLLLPIHLHHWIVYMIINGITGVLDHSGIKFRIANIYDTADHDAHHSKFTCNYSFPFPYMDILHGTYLGTFKLFGREIHFTPKSWQKERFD